MGTRKLVERDIQSNTSIAREKRGFKQLLHDYSLASLLTILRILMWGEKAPYSTHVDKKIMMM